MSFTSFSVFLVCVRIHTHATDTSSSAVQGSSLVNLCLHSERTCLSVISMRCTETSGSHGSSSSRRSRRRQRMTGQTFANTSITASGRKMYIAVCDGEEVLVPRWAVPDERARTHMRVEHACSAVRRRRPPSRHRHPQLTWQLSLTMCPRREAKSAAAFRIEE